jgi:cytochrome c-type biogenesis protein CcmH
MTTFLVVAAFMAAIAATAVALPLLRHRQSRILGAAAGVLVIGAAAALYPLWSNWNWHAPAQRAASPDVLAMVAKLEQRMRDQPNDVAGWLMLGRSYLALDRLDDAILAYDHAHRLDASNVDAMLGLGEAVSLRAGGDITPAAAQLFEQAVTAAPENPKALLYGGFAAAVRGDRATARSRWQALKNLHPPEQVMAMLDARIAELGPAQANAAGGLNEARGANSAGGPGPALTPPAPASTAGAGVPPDQGTAPGAAAPGDAEATVNLTIAPALKARLTGDAPLFVFAREPGSRGPPLAAKRLTSSAIGTQIHLSSADSMMPGRALVAGQRVSITARVSFSGQPLPAAGDLYGELSYDVGRDGVRNLVIDRVAQ